VGLFVFHNAMQKQMVTSDGTVPMRIVPSHSDVLLLFEYASVEGHRVEGFVLHQLIVVVRRPNNTMKFMIDLQRGQFLI